MDTSPLKDRHVLIAADKSESSKRAVLYVADFLGGVQGIRVTLLYIIPEPTEDYFDSEAERREWIEKDSAEARRMLENYAKILEHAGFPGEKVNILIGTNDLPTISECILKCQQALNCCTIVLGRRGISKKEEFLFSSTSNKLLHAEKNCALWIVE
jgi:nucleotide-binding universal stress UspA family protein